jgi:predicted nuclease with TOPRIM domain
LTASWYYYTKYKDLERDFSDLNNNLTKMSMENTNYRVRIKDLQKYKNDVSKTFKILDNELVHINNHVEKNNQQLQSQQTQLPIPQLQNQPNRINLLSRSRHVTHDDVDKDHLHHLGQYEMPKYSGEEIQKELGLSKPGPEVGKEIAKRIADHYSDSFFKWKNRPPMA